MNTEERRLALTVPSHDAGNILTQLESHNLQVAVVQRNRLGGAELVTLLVSLSSLTVTAIGRVIVEQIRARKEIEVTVNGIKMKGISEVNAVEVLKQCLAQSQKSSAADTSSPHELPGQSE